MAIHSSVLAWKTLWTEVPGGLQSVGSQRVGHDLAIEHAHTQTKVTQDEMLQRVRIKRLQRKQFHHRIEGEKWGPSKKEKGPKDQGVGQPSWDGTRTDWVPAEVPGIVLMGSLSVSLPLSHLFIHPLYWWFIICQAFLCMSEIQI